MGGAGLQLFETPPSQFGAATILMLLGGALSVATRQEDASLAWAASAAMLPRRHHRRLPVWFFLLSSPWPALRIYRRCERLRIAHHSAAPLATLAAASHSSGASHCPEATSQAKAADSSSRPASVEA